MAQSFDNITNFRDVGQTINKFLGRRAMREGVLYRSARPDNATSADRIKLRDELNIRTIMDLRSKTEHIKRAKERQALLQASPSEDAATAAVTESAQIPGLQYLEIAVTGRRFERFMLSQLSWYGFFTFLILYLLGYRLPAIQVLGREVMAPQGLIGLGIATLDNSGAELVEALRTLISPSSPQLPVLIHCTQGKDRTGLLVMLILSVLGDDCVPEAAIAYDYGLSKPAAQAETAASSSGSPQAAAATKAAALALAAEMRQVGLPPSEWADAPDNFVPRILAHLGDKYGGVDAYLDGHGFDAGCRERLIDALGA